MPHIRIEHDKETKNSINLAELAKKLHTTLAKQETVKLESVKTRTIEVDNVIVGAGEYNRMIHIDVHLLGGRSVQLKEEMARALYDSVYESLEEVNTSLSVNISELGVYKKT